MKWEYVGYKNERFSFFGFEMKRRKLKINLVVNEVVMWEKGKFGINILEKLKVILLFLFIFNFIMWGGLILSMDKMCN